MATPAVGADVESMCGKCGDVWHVVVAKVGDRIAKVQCKQCGAPHRHSPPAAVREKERLAKEAARAARSSSSRISTPGAPRASRTPRAPAGPLVPPDRTRPPRPYSPTATFAVADVVQHPSFGDGVVELLPEPGKMQVYFPDGRRVLVTGKTQSAPLLTRRRSTTGDEP